ncbi:MAG TPA: hypothetical protein VMB73_03320 [Acetobacteraceae bacterium]|jgi:hypothetical protein|nr:hypothetical protein [Acetobacteraceae bacterium]
MKQIEDRFQAIVTPIVAKQAGEVTAEQKGAIDKMYALWYMRARYRELDEQEVQLREVDAHLLTKEQEENLEKNGYMFARGGGKMPTRQLNGLALEMRINKYALQLATGVTRWGVISPQSGEFIVPDVPLHTVLPLAPTLALVASAPDGVIVEQNLAEVNQAMRVASREYFFARDLSKCPM